ncbi:MAG: caspase family protein [Pirellula sp.]
MDFLPGGALSGLQSRLIFIFMITVSLMIVLTADAQDKVALLIACQDYQEITPLRSPRNDMAYLARELEHLGYNVTRIEGKGNDVLDKDQILNEVKKFKNNFQSIDDVFVCLSGHGIQLYSERNDGLYFVPEKASSEDLVAYDDPGSGFYLDNSLVSIAEIVDLLQNREFKNLTLVLDCCRINAKKADEAVNPEKMKPRKDSEPKINIVYATPLGQAAFESKSQLGILEFEDLTDSGIHSNFTFQLIKYLRGECRPEDYVTLESGLKKLDLNKALKTIEEHFGTLPAYPWDVQQYTARLEKRKTIRIGTSQALEFFLIDARDAKGKKIQLVDKFLLKQPKLIDATIKMPYYLGVTEVSRQNWIDCLSDPISADFLREIDAPKDLQEDLLKRFKTAAGSTDLPASCTWPEAVLYCQLMTKRLHPQERGFYKIDGLEVSKNKQERSVTGIEFQYNPKAYGFRLPAEVQWHWAVFQNGNPIEVIKKSPSGVLKALRNGVKPPLGPVGLADPNEQNTFGFRYALGNMAEWIWDDWSRTESIRVLTAAENPTKIGKEKKLGDKLLKGAGILDKITDQRRQSKPGSLDEDTGLRLLYQPPPVQ